jgi:hypothetical protein
VESPSPRPLGLALVASGDDETAGTTPTGSTVEVLMGDGFPRHGRFPPWYQGIGGRRVFPRLWKSPSSPGLAWPGRARVTASAGDLRASRVASAPRRVRFSTLQESVRRLAQEPHPPSALAASYSPVVHWIGRGPCHHRPPGASGVDGNVGKRCPPWPESLCHPLSDPGFPSSRRTSCSS